MLAQKAEKQGSPNTGYERVLEKGEWVISYGPVVVFPGDGNSESANQTVARFMRQGNFSSARTVPIRTERGRISLNPRHLNRQAIIVARR